MENPRDNKTSSERARMFDWERDMYRLWLDWTMPSQETPANRLWFKDATDRLAFSRLVSALGGKVETGEGGAQ
jgi:hypothetical protein